MNKALLVIFVGCLAVAVACAGAVPGPESAPAFAPADEGAARFSETEYGSVVDHRTGLEWYVGPDRKTFIRDARAFAADLRAGGRDDWRLPYFRELRTIRRPGSGPKNLSPIFKTSGDMIWASELTIFGYTYLRLVDGSMGFDTLGRRKHGFRVFAVRQPGNAR